MDIFSKIEIAKGQRVIAMSNIPIITKNEPFGSKLILSRVTQLLPKINIGIFKGKTNKGIKIPRCLAFRVKAEPNVPIKLKVGVPQKREIIRVPMLEPCICNASPRSGAISITGRPVVNQCVIIFVSAIIV